MVLLSNWIFKTEHELFCSERNSLQPAAVRFNYFQGIFGLACNHGKLGILNCLKDLLL